MSVGLRVNLTKILDDPALVGFLAQRNKVFAKAVDQKNARLSDEELQKAFKQGKLKRSTVREAVSEFATADAVVFRNHGSNVCPICLPLNGKVFKRGDDVPIPPLHFNCKCDLQPIFKDDRGSLNATAVVEKVRPADNVPVSVLKRALKRGVVAKTTADLIQKLEKEEEEEEREKKSGKKR